MKNKKCEPIHADCGIDIDGEMELRKHKGERNEKTGGK